MTGFAVVAHLIWKSPFIDQDWFVSWMVFCILQVNNKVVLPSYYKYHDTFFYHWLSFLRLNNKSIPKSQFMYNKITKWMDCSTFQDNLALDKQFHPKNFHISTTNCFYNYQSHFCCWKNIHEHVYKSESNFFLHLCFHSWTARINGTVFTCGDGKNTLESPGVLRVATHLFDYLTRLFPKGLVYLTNW